MNEDLQKRWEAYATKAGFLDDENMVLPGQHERAATSFYTWEACEKSLAAIDRSEHPATDEQGEALKGADFWIVTALAEMEGIDTADENNCLKAAVAALQKARDDLSAQQAGTEHPVGSALTDAAQAVCREFKECGWSKDTSDAILRLDELLAATPSRAPASVQDGTGEPIYAKCYVCDRPMDGLSEADCHCFHRKELAPNAAPAAVSDEQIDAIALGLFGEPVGGWNESVGRPFARAILSLRAPASVQDDGYAQAPGNTDAERAAWLADKIAALGDYAREASSMLYRWPTPKAAPAAVSERIGAATEALSYVLAFVPLSDERQTQVSRALSGLRAIQSLASPPSVGEPTEEAIGAAIYKGNTVSFMYQKAKAYGDTCIRMWGMLAAAGYNNGPNGNRHVEEMLRDALATDSAKPAGACRTCSGRGYIVTATNRDEDAQEPCPECNVAPDSKDALEVGKPVAVKTVPVEPTVAMINAGQCGCMDNDVTVSIYKAMLAAAPDSQGAPKPVAWRYTNARGQFRYVGNRPAPRYDHLLHPVPLYAAPSDGAQAAGQDARDAARYRWLRERNAILDNEEGIFTAYRVTASDGTFDHNELIAFEQMDAAIDAARATQGDAGSRGET